MEDKYQEVSSSIIDYLDEVSITSMPDRLKDNVFHYDITSNKTGERGSGSDYSKEVAFLKAQGELVERITFNLVKRTNTCIRTSNGFAAHSTIAKAKDNAFKEIIERDLFLTSWFSGQYPCWDFKPLLNYDHNYIKSELELFQENGLGLKVGYVGRCDQSHCVIGVLYDLTNRFGGVFSSAADQNINIALRKVIADHRRMATYILNTVDRDLPLFSNKNKLTKPTDHQNFFLNTKMQDFIDDYINNNQKPIELPSIDKHYNIFELPKAITGSIKVVQCLSDQAQNYFIGSDLSLNINKSRIKEVGALDQSRSIHPFG